MQNLYEGQYTSYIYGLIKDQNYTEAIKILNTQLEINPRSRAALSLLGYCSYMSQNYVYAAEMYDQLLNRYEQLIKYYPEIVEYRIYLAQSLYKGENYIEALKACQNIERPELAHQLTILQFACKYQMNELSNAHVLLNNADPEKQETLISHGCILYKEGKYEESKTKFEEAKRMGESSDIEYNIGVCCYKSKMLTAACVCFQNILERAVKEHPELMVSQKVDGLKTQSFANSQALFESCLIEAYNLKAAIEYMLKNVQAAKDALNDMPPREDSELDSVTLHNLALVEIEKDPDDSFKKLNFILKNPPCPPEALANLLILYCKYEQYDLAHDVLSENSELKMKYLTQEEIDYISALSMMRTSKEAAYESLQKLGSIYLENIRKHLKLINDARTTKDKQLFNKILQDYDMATSKYLPILTAQAKIYWDMGNYEFVEKILRQQQVEDYYNDNPTWKINLGHAYFIQETNFKEAIRYYKDVYSNTYDILSIPASVIANLCVSLIMVQRNEDAQDIIKRVEEEEIKALSENPDRQLFHTCIVNLIVGTLYCSKGNYEFGIGRIIVSFQHFHKRMNMDTWYYSKRCFLSLVENLAKQIMVIPDKLYMEIINFLDQADIYGKNIATQIADTHNSENHEKFTVSSEARLLKKMFLRLRVYYEYAK